MPLKIWLITGTSSGLGRAVTEQVLSEGQIVVATAHNLDSLNDLKALYPATRLLTLQLDVTSKSDIKTAFSMAVEHFGRVDVVYSNSGYGILGELESIEESAARSLLDVNMWGAADVALEAIRVFRDVNTPAGGRLLLASSYVGVTAMAGMGHYASSKFAIDGYHEALSKEVDPSWNIKITILELGAFATNAFGNAPISQPHPAYLNTPIADMRRLWADPDETFRALGAKPASTAAKILFDIAGDEAVPLRIPVGLDSIGILKGRAEEITASTEYAERWRELLQ
ncbi:NAD-P-binding protein [Flagelloscypha sp. PMI_526]|nr:NAD-P-binding protein [Flagelloscypha sp. PMI_526]